MNSINIFIIFGVTGDLANRKIFPAINALLNKIPLIGQVITGIEGDGLIGVNFKVTGTYDEPNYNVNPLSILTPGILRSIFESFFEGNTEDKITE